MYLTSFKCLALTVGIIALSCAKPGFAIAQIVRIPDAHPAQMTNAIPTNLFLTDENLLFWYKKNERLVEVNRIKDAEQLPEARPAEQDPEGHWGEVAHGLQVSFRLKKQIFTKGEPIEVFIFVRNVTNKPVSYVPLTQVSGTRNGKPLVQKGAADGEISISSPMGATVFPQTQKKRYERLDQLFDLAEPGEYFFQATYRHPDITSQKVTITIKN
jgi:hypothetical protein